MLDTIHRVETPEGVDLDLRVAGPPARFLAWLIDFAVRLLVGTGIFFLLLLFGNFGIGVFLLILFLLEWLYPVLFEVLSDGATPGKKALRLLVVHEDGTPVGWEASTLRNLVRAADLVPMFYVSGLVAILFTDSFQRLGDLAAGTLVIYRDEKRRQRDVPEVPPHRAPVPLRLAEQRSVISFGQRGPQLPPARAKELAGIAEPLMRMDPAPISDPVRYLYQIAAFLVGRRAAE